MIKTLIFIVISTIFCYSQNIVDSLLIQEKNDRIFTTYVYEEEESISLFNWYFKEGNLYYNYFSYISVDNNLKITMVNDTNFQLDNYSDVIKKDDGYFIADNDVVNGHTRILYFDGTDVSVKKVISESIKFKNSFFHNDLMFSTVNDAIYKDPDSLHLKFYISNLEGEFLDSIIYKGLDRKGGQNFNFRHSKPFKEDNNTYILGAKANMFYQEYYTYVLKFNSQNKLEFIKQLQLEKDSIVTSGTTIYKYFDKYLIVGFEDDRKNKILYQFIKEFDSNFNEIEHHRYQLYGKSFFNELIINKDSSITVYGKRSIERSPSYFDFMKVELNKEFEITDEQVMTNGEIESGFHYAVPRDNFDIVIGFKGDYLYIAKFDKAQLSVDRKIEDYNVIYNIQSNKLEFNKNIPNTVEIIDLLGKQYYESKVNTRTLNLPDLPKNQIIFAKMTFENSVYVQRIK